MFKKKLSKLNYHDYIFYLNKEKILVAKNFIYNTLYFVIPCTLYLLKHTIFVKLILKKSSTSLPKYLVEKNLKLTVNFFTEILYNLLYYNSKMFVVRTDLFTSGKV